MNLSIQSKSELAFKPTHLPAAFIRMKEAAKRDKAIRFHTLMHQIRVDLLKSAYHKLNAKRACGLDGVTKKEYGRNLDINLKNLEDRIHQGKYSPDPSRQILIPKGNGQTRPLAISNFEDKIVQLAVMMILEALYEPLFTKRSLGFRPKRGAHQAIRTAYHLLHTNGRPYVIECDLEKFFDTVDHSLLVKYLQKRIIDPRFLKLIEQLLKTGIKEVSGKIRKNIQGTPQGSVVSPILSNIYLHYSLDLWFEKNYANHFQCQIRYADDVMFCFNKLDKAKSFYRSLKSRLKEVHLSLNENKSRIVDFRVSNRQVFNLLGFTFYWGLDAKRKPLLKVKTQTEKLAKSILEFKTWIKANRNRFKLSILWEQAALKLRGHYAYYGVTLNKRTHYFYLICTKLLYKWLNRRSQKYSFSWGNFMKKLRHYPLPKPWGKEAVNIAQGTFDYAY